MAESKLKDHAEDIVVIVHGDIDAAGRATRAAFEAVWKDKGFKIDSVVTRFGEGTGSEPTGYGAEESSTASTAADLAGGSPPAGATTTKAK